MKEPDMHVHTLHSHDSEETMEAYCEKAVSLGLPYLCFTDHVDWMPDGSPREKNKKTYSPQAFFASLSKARKQYEGKLHIPVSYTHLDVYKRQEMKPMKINWIFTPTSTPVATSPMTRPTNRPITNGRCNVTKPRPISHVLCAREDVYKRQCACRSDDDNRLCQREGKWNGLNKALDCRLSTMRSTIQGVYKIKEAQAR